MSSGTQFTITQYGQDRLVMDWFALQDPFDQYLPIKIVNNWSGGLYFNYNLSGQPAYYSNVSGSLSGVLAGAVPLTAGSSDTYVIRWAVSISGQIDKSGPNTDNLTIYITAYASGFLSGTLASGLVTTKNVLYNRYSGVIKVFGDQYSSDQPIPSLASAANGTLASGQTYSYAISYFLSGWESDIGAPAALAIDNSGANRTITATWNGVASVTQYAVWRWSGGVDFTVQTTMSGAMDLIGIVSGLSITDSGISPLQTGIYRMRYWRGATQNSDTTIFLSPPASRNWPNTTQTLNGHTFQLAKNISGVSLLGPFYIAYHLKGNLAGGTINQLLNQITPQAIGTSGTLVADPTVFKLAPTSNWARFGLYFSGVTLTATTSGIVTLQISNQQSVNIDDVYVVANS